MRLSFAIRALAFAALLLATVGGAPAVAQVEVVSETTATRLEVAALPSSPGRFLLSATVTTGFGHGVADGRIVFYDLTTSTVLGWTDAGRPSLTVERLAPGRHLLRADYAGSASRLPLIVLPSQSAEVALDVRATPRLILSSSHRAPPPGAVVTLTAAVTGAQGVPSGAVSFRDGERVIAAHVPLDRTGLATFTTSALDDGIGGILVVYDGDGRYEPASARIEPTDEGPLAQADAPRM
ncbi:Ig-like domain-containing protein [Rhodopseudomonas thermotolerans]|uniref:Ig-like domain-containing protein n=2 Tax=Rhodopseudomonas TaxID=1073 RepID=A0A336JQB2_9BRAD|nr:MULTISPECIES: Ig-like domain-containing protein [Rhodopseudomonas]RED31782.1 Ig-like domain-containing protein [Rhodopseudomonas pentothenatexigens]REF93083.1 Ig-like domain-containing protein [Rhodopseudomonas thermotolerans]SSW91762.1 Ig-like domain-containing protein [Rhodopseudomonas pentothenatexigens]